MVAEPHTIDMGEVHSGWAGQWVKIKPYLSYAADQSIEAAKYQISVAKGEDRGEVQIAGLGMACAMADHCIVEWNLLDYEGTPLPQGRQGIMHELASRDLIDQMIGQINDFYESQRPEVFREIENDA